MTRHIGMVFASAIALGTGGIGVASAADMAVKAPLMVAAPFSWTGCYVGGNAGWKQGRYRDGSVDVPATAGPIGAITPTAPADFIRLDSVTNGSGAVGGQVGCRWENPQHWVFGIEGDFDWTNLRGSVTNRGIGTGFTFVPGDVFENRMRWESSIRGTVGRSFDKLLVYGTGGVAFAQVTMSGNFIPTIGTFIGGAPGPYPGSFGSSSQVLVGGTIGAGLAYAFTKNWEIGAEYRYSWYQGGNYGLGPVAGLCGLVGGVAVTIACINQNATGHRGLETNEVLLKLNYRFDWAGPVVAKY